MSSQTTAERSQRTPTRSTKGSQYKHEQSVARKASFISQKWKTEELLKWKLIAIVRFIIELLKQIQLNFKVDWEISSSFVKIKQCSRSMRSSNLASKRRQWRVQILTDFQKSYFFDSRCNYLMSLRGHHRVRPVSGLRKHVWSYTCRSELIVYSL